MTQLNPLTNANPLDVARFRAADMKTEQAARAKFSKASRIDKAAEEFEAVFVTQMLEHMFEGIKADEVFGGGASEDMYRSFMLDEYGKLIARSGGVGVADYVKRELIRMQEVVPHE